VTRTLEVTFDGRSLSDLNELEYIDGEVWANVWYQDVLVAINPESGEVTKAVDLSALYPDRQSNDQVLNGIAWDEQAERLFVTGKLWPSLYEIRLVPFETP
jgi:glutamine cyclotransferase